MYLVIADDQPWIDSEGRDEWILTEAVALADLLVRQGYRVKLEPA